METKQTTELSVIEQSREKFELACKDAASLQIANNFGAAFQAVSIVALLREALTDEVMNKVFIPLMNTKVGFLTDRTGKASGNRAPKPLYDIPVVRDAIIDAVSIGLLPTGNQFNIIAERMYPTKEGYTALLKKLGIKYFIEVSFDKGANPNFAEIPCKISYEHNGEKNTFGIVATVKKDDYSSHDSLRGKAERRAKKALFEYITGCDFGDADETSSLGYQNSKTPVQTPKIVLEIGTEDFKEACKAFANGIEIEAMREKFEMSPEVERAIENSMFDQAKSVELFGNEKQ